MPISSSATPHDLERMKAQIAENVRAELARAQIPHTSLPDIIGMTRQNASKRWSGETAYFAHEIALLAAVLDISAGRLLDCAPRPVVADLAAGPALRRATPSAE